MDTFYNRLRSYFVPQSQNFAAPITPTDFNSQINNLRRYTNFINNNNNINTNIPNQPINQPINQDQQQQAQIPQTNQVNQINQNNSNYPLLDLIRGKESNGDPDTLFNNAQRNKFRGYSPSIQTVQQVGDFTSPSGQYAQYVKGLVGRTATPVGAYQIVGTNLRDQGLLKEAGVSPSDQFNLDTQNKIGTALFNRAYNNGSGDWLSRVRNTWTGLRNVPDNVLINYVNQNYNRRI